MINDTNEHVLVGLSSSPSNEKIVKTADKMAKAFNAKFTALYVKTTKDDKMSLDDKSRLKSNISLAESLGATVVTIYGDDISFQTSNKQLNFLQVIYRSLKADGNARCAVVLPDNVLFAGGDGTSVRHELMDFCKLHTILRLPTGIFYAQGVKTNVLFFTRGKTEKSNTKEVAFYDMRTNMDSFGKTRTLRYEDFAEFIEGYNDPAKRTGERWSKFTREEIETKYDDSLDLGLIKDDSIIDADELPDPIESGEEAIAQLEEAVDLLKSVVRELKALSSEE